MLNHFKKHILGILYGIAFVSIMFFVYQKFLLTSVDTTNSSTNNVPYLVYPRIEIEEVSQLKLAISQMDEKINSVNKRIDDLYIFGGIIITLLLAINVGIFVNAQSHVKAHLEENYDKYRLELLNLVEEANKDLGKIKAELEYLKKAREQVTEIKEPPAEQ